MDGNHDIQRSYDVTLSVQTAVVEAMQRHKVMLEGIIFKPNFVRPGSDAPPVSATIVARETVRVLQNTLPAAVPGVVFLSGGMTDEFATECLNEINKLPLDPRPWTLSFSYGRALQQSVLKIYLGKAENVEAAQKELLLRAKANSLASLGTYADRFVHRTHATSVLAEIQSAVDACSVSDKDPDKEKSSFAEELMATAVGKQNLLFVQSVCLPATVQ